MIIIFLHKPCHIFSLLLNAIDLICSKRKKTKEHSPQHTKFQKYKNWHTKILEFDSPSCRFLILPTNNEIRWLHYINIIIANYLPNLLIDKIGICYTVCYESYIENWNVLLCLKNASKTCNFREYLKDWKP